MPHQSESRVRRIVERVAANAAGSRLDRFVRELLEKGALPDASNAFVRKLIVAGAVRVNGRVIHRPAFALASRSQVEVFIDPARIDVGRGAAAAPGRVEVLYQDADLIAVAKPPGLATHPGADTRRASLVTLVQAWLTSKGSRTAPYLGVHQRLDRDTSGVVLFTLSERANPALAQAFREHSIEKVYHAICAGARGVRLVPGESLHISGSLALEGTGRTSRMMPSAGGMNAETDVRIVEHLGLAILVEARPVPAGATRFVRSWPPSTYRSSVTIGTGSVAPGPALSPA